MSLALTSKFDYVYQKDSAKLTKNELNTRIVDAFQKILSARWSSSGLKENNSFTTTLVLRALGYLVQMGVIPEHAPKKNYTKKWSYEKLGTAKHKLPFIASELAKNPERFRINNYSPAAAVVYWFVDGVNRAKIKLEVCQWVELAKQAIQEFNRQRSLVAAEHDAIMDPVSLAMSACLCHRIRAIVNCLEEGSNRPEFESLPSEVELDDAILSVFSKQTLTGIWPKYFPMFHYQDAGSNFCFTFEMLEAILVEFGYSKGQLIKNINFIEGFEKAIEWCVKNRLPYRFENVKYTGWNSGGNLETLKKGQPEAWATAVVHMFLWKLDDVLTEHIQTLLKIKYKATDPQKNTNALDEFLDVDIIIRNHPKSLKDVLRDEIITPAQKQSISDIRKNGLKGKLSALLFGPPGTSKTETAKTIAKCIGWPLIEIDPSHFLVNGIENIYKQSDMIFNELSELCGVVVLFDEMDALVQTRDDKNLRLDITSQFLTTSMLPKLAKLHDNAKAIFLMATNFQEKFDPAIKRAGRFDLLLCMGPPNNSSKCEMFHKFIKKELNKETKLYGDFIKETIFKDKDLSDVLSLFTFGDFKTFIRALIVNKKFDKIFKSKNKKLFIKELKEFSDFNGLRIKDLDDLKTMYPKFKHYTLSDFEKESIMTTDLYSKADLKIHQIIRYIVDKRQSKIQA